MKWLLRAVWEVWPISWLDRAMVDASAGRVREGCDGSCQAMLRGLAGGAPVRYHGRRFTG